MGQIAIIYAIFLLLPSALGLVYKTIFPEFTKYRIIPDFVLLFSQLLISLAGLYLFDTPSSLSLMPNGSGLIESAFILTFSREKIIWVTALSVFILVIGGINVVRADQQKQKPSGVMLFLYLSLFLGTCAFLSQKLGISFFFSEGMLLAIVEYGREKNSKSITKSSRLQRVLFLVVLLAMTWAIATGAIIDRADSNMLAGVAYFVSILFLFRTHSEDLDALSLSLATLSGTFLLYGIYQSVEIGGSWHYLGWLFFLISGVNLVRATLNRNRPKILFSLQVAMIADAMAMFLFDDRKKTGQWHWLTIFSLAAIAAIIFVLFNAGRRKNSTYKIAVAMLSAMTILLSRALYFLDANAEFSNFGLVFSAGFVSAIVSSIVIGNFALLVVNEAQRSGESSEGSSRLKSPELASLFCLVSFVCTGVIVLARTILESENGFQMSFKNSSVLMLAANGVAVLLLGPLVYYFTKRAHQMGVGGLDVIADLKILENFKEEQKLRFIFSKIEALWSLLMGALEPFWMRGRSLAYEFYPKQEMFFQGFLSGKIEHSLESFSQLIRLFYNGVVRTYFLWVISFLLWLGLLFLRGGSI